MVLKERNSDHQAASAADQAVVTYEERYGDHEILEQML
jgi:hypothetical protein